MAFAAVNSAIFALMEIEDSPRISISSSTLEDESYEPDEYILRQWKLLTITLQCCSEVVTAADEGIIIDEARRFQDAIEFAMSTQFLEQFKSGKPTFSLKLDHLKHDVDRFTEAAEKMRRRIEELWDQKVAKMIEEDVVEICVPPQKEEEEEEYVSASASATEMVGLCDEFNRVRDTLTRPPGSANVLIIYHSFYWISGMAGVGKTTFVERIYHDPLMNATFERRAFVRVGREYRIERVLRDISTQLNHGDEKMMKEGDEEDPYENLYTALVGKRCLVVLDDVLEKLVELERSFYYRGSWILVTSRMEPRLTLHRLKLRFLNEEESWELLKRKVFDEIQQVCPPLLVEPGKKIAKICGGLPLLIIAVADQLLSEVEKNQESWKRVAEKPNSVLEEASHQISEVLITSYNHIDERYKLCFLYLAAFPQSHVIFSSMIMSLWYAEGFGDFCPYSDSFWELFQNNLVITDEEKSFSIIGKAVKACRLHCAYWYLCKRVAKENRFLYIMNSNEDAMDECVTSHHRLAVQTNVLLAIEEVADMIASIPTVRSLLCTGPYLQYQVTVVCSEWKLLRVLDALTIRLYEFPDEVVNLILLRYLSLSCNANIPPSISKLWSLQFLILHQHSRIRRVAAHDHDQSYYVPVEIWELQELISLEIPGRNLPLPPHPGVFFPNLEQLLGVGVESCTQGVLQNIPNLMKLRIQTELPPDDAAAATLILVTNIVSFQCEVMNPTLSHPPPPLPIPIFGLTKLSLSGCGYAWEEMSKIGKLPNLRVLKLRCYAFRGEKWVVNQETEFRQLEYLYIEDTDLVQWSVTGKAVRMSFTVTGNTTMPCLGRLTMKNCYKLHEIPRFTSMFMMIELVDCNPKAETCANLSDTQTKVSASYSWKRKAT